MASRSTIKRQQYIKTISESGYMLCGICNGRIDSPWDVTVDHIIPKSMGGSNRVDNLQPAHESCNWKKGNGKDESSNI